MDASENILLIRLKSIGDILFTLPAIHAVRQNFPAAKLHFLVSKEFAALLRGFSEIDEVIPFDRANFRSKNFPAICYGAFHLVRQLRGKNFSLAIDFQGYGETAWLSWLTGAPERWSSIYRWPRAWASTRGEWRDISIHPADWNLTLLERCGLRASEIRNEFILPADAFAEAESFFVANRLEKNRPTLFLQPFTSTPGKNWPLEKFLELARHFHSRGAQIIFGGGPKERDALAPARAAGFVVSAGAPLLVSAALTQLSTLIIGADTGLLHLAVALGKRVLMLAPPGIPTFPFRHRDWLVSPPGGKIVPEIEVAAVIAAAATALEK